MTDKDDGGDAARSFGGEWVTTRWRASSSRLKLQAVPPPQTVDELRRLITSRLGRYCCGASSVILTIWSFCRPYLQDSSSRLQFPLGTVHWHHPHGRHQQRLSSVDNNKRETR